ncbi:MAG: hypothetical protein KGZ33_01710 [Alkaliphilus sp.]|nr:hypothetical protein [Alkaliphilus sp.]
MEAFINNYAFRKLDRKLFEYVDKLDLKVGFNVKAYLETLEQKLILKILLFENYLMFILKRLVCSSE